MKTLARSQISAFIASVVDILVMIFLVEVPGMGPGTANIAGNVSGGVVNFFLNRQWTFMAGDRKLELQMGRYMLVWIGYIALSYAAIMIGTQWLQLNYLVVKIISSVVLGLVYNFMLHKHFVYK